MTVYNRVHIRSNKRSSCLKNNRQISCTSVVTVTEMNLDFPLLEKRKWGGHDYVHLNLISPHSSTMAMVDDVDLVSSSNVQPDYHGLAGLASHPLRIDPFDLCVPWKISPLQACSNLFRPSWL